SQNGIEINTAALGFDNELLDFLNVPSCSVRKSSNSLSKPSAAVLISIPFWLPFRSTGRDSVAEMNLMFLFQRKKSAQVYELRHKNRGVVEAIRPCPSPEWVEPQGPGRCDLCSCGPQRGGHDNHT